MSAAIGPLRFSRTLHGACVVCCGASKRFYAPRSASFDNDVAPLNRVPSRVRRRLTKQGLAVDDNQFLDLVNGAPVSKDATNYVDGTSTISPPFAANADFTGTSHELETLVKDMAGSGSAQNSPEGDRPTELFPSDTQRYEDWGKKRDQSKKAFRPSIDPSKTSLILFPGQGSQFVGMGNDTVAYGRAQELFEEASAVLKYDLLKLCLSGPISALSKTVHCQPAVLVSSLAAIEKLQDQTPEAIETCVGTAGFSVGEYAALVFAGVMSFADAVKVVQVRAEAMQQASEEVPSGMMTTFLGRRSELKTAMLAAREYCQQRCGISEPVCAVANYLYPECKVIAGHIEALDFVAEHAKTFGILRTKRLPVSGAFHTKLMSSARKPVKDVLSKITLNDPQVPVYSNVSASRFRQNKVTELLQQQITAPVKWEQIMHVMYSRRQGEEFPASYEVGPGKQLGTMLKMVNLKAHEKYTQVKV